MEGFASRFIALLAFAAVVACSCIATAATPDVWRHDVEAAWAKAKETGRPLVLFVTTDGCFFCDKMLKETCKDPAVTKELSAGFIPVVVHTRNNLELVRRLNVRSFPTTVIVSHKGDIVAAKPGFLNVAEMRASLRLASAESATHR